jgi:hypothetical protein
MLDIFFRFAGGVEAERRVHVIICGQNHAPVSSFERLVSSSNEEHMPAPEA